MAVELSAETVVAVGVLLGGMATALGLLWKALRRDNGVMIGRIRQLEDSRVADAEKHASEYRQLCERQITVQQQTNNILREVLTVLRARPCTADQETTPRPHNLPDVQTDILTAKAGA